MGYKLRIGNLNVQYFQDEEDPCIRLRAECLRHDNAPAFGEITDYGNSREPSYTAWHDFAQFVGLYNLFFGNEPFNKERVRDDALLANHPGCVPLTERHRCEINAALAAYKAKFPKAIPTFGKPAQEGEIFWVDKENPEENAYMARLIWLHYWVNWALDNCEKPVFENT
jgi:hypothetical protein